MGCVEVLSVVRPRIRFLQLCNADSLKLQVGDAKTQVLSVSVQDKKGTCSADEGRTGKTSIWLRNPVDTRGLDQWHGKGDS